MRCAWQCAQLVRSDRLTWGTDNGTCAVRVVGHGDGLHLEIRLPEADANPYLARSPPHTTASIIACSPRRPAPATPTRPRRGRSLARSTSLWMPSTTAR
ncbi:hypothetical protein AB0F13_04030 [Streptomyces sp. NPDC026206]|uniref:hypothetical protein n=1 Tax=Streptomyces sp. NPDC026206 TaxID=3157089 RepID=UPI0033DE3DC5